MTKRILVLLLVAVLSLSVLTACGGDKGGTTTTIGDNNVTTTTATDANGDPVTTTTATDAEGNPITTTTVSGQTTLPSTTAPVDVNNTLELPFAETHTWSLYMTEHAYQPIDVAALKFNAITELTNVVLDVDVGVGDSAKTKLMAAAASGKMYDITKLSNQQARTYNPSLFVDLAKMIKTKTPNYYNAVKNDWQELQLFNVDGRMLGFVSAGHTDVEYQPVVQIYLPQHILDDNNLDHPETWNEWFDLMKTLKKKYPESTPMSNRQTSNFLHYWTFMLGMRDDIHFDFDSNKFVCGATDPKFQKVLQFMKDCYDEGLIDPSFKALTESILQTGATTGKVFCWIDSGSPGNKINNIMQTSNPNAKFVQTNMLTSPVTGTKHAYKSSNAGNFADMYCIGSHVQDLDEILAFMDWCYTEEGFRTNTFGREGETYTVNSKGEVVVPTKIWTQFFDAENEVPDSYGWMSKYGLGALCFAPWNENNANYYQWEGYEFYPKDPNAEDPLWKDDLDAGYIDTPLVNITPDVDVTLIDRYESINYYIYNQALNFIDGTRPLTEFNTFVAELKKMGVEELLTAANS